MIEITRFPKILILLLVFTFANFMALLITPALPDLAHAFHITPGLTTRAMSIFLIGYAVGQLPYGPLANRFGRKKAFTIGACIAFIGTLLAYSTKSFDVFCLGRFLQAVGSASGLKVVFTMIGDVHSGNRAAKAVATLSSAFGLIPGIATAIGGFATSFAGWRGCFIVLMLYTVILWLLTLFLPETAQELQKDALQVKKIVTGYLRQLKNLDLVLYAFLAGLTTTSLYIFMTLAPSIGIELIGLSPDQFGLWTIAPSIGIFVGAFISRRLSSQDPSITMLSGIILFILSITTLSLFFMNGIVNVWTLFLPPFVMYVGTNLTWSRALAQGLSDTKDKSNASAVMQFINLGTTTIGVFLVELLPPTTIMLMPVAYWIISILLLATWLRLSFSPRA